MSRPTLRLLAFSVFIGLAAAGGVQAQVAAPAAAAAVLPDFTGIVQQNAPAVVHVEAKYNGRSQPRIAGKGAGGDDQEEILRRFFGMPMMPSPEDQKHISLGSGFIISSDGYILTNNHVVDHADEVTVRLQDRRTLTAKVVGTDPQYDIALLKVDVPGKLPTVHIGESQSLKPGQWVLAIGSPFGFDYTVTQGIVSAIGRNLGSGDQPYTSFIQTDVPINRGNSGGPLFNLQGQVVGINSQIYSNTGGYQGVAFSIPIDVAMNAVEQLKTKGFVTRGQLGVMVQGISDDMVKVYKLDRGAGAAVTQVSPDSGAEKAGIEPGDIILKYNGQEIDQPGDLPPLVGLTKPGAKVPVEILRDGRHKTLEVTVGSAPRDPDAVSSTGSASVGMTGAKALGLTVGALGADDRKQMGLRPGEGVQITDISGEAAAQAGLRPGDVILRVDQKAIGSVADFKSATKDVKAGSTVLLLVRRGDQSSFIGVTVPEGK
ncbi:DegQ family serine endoprotease [Dyella lutea]|uniref:Probable periplasmic serine endoprotease DegP-like n=1 Tax=Dyella lutea TaxID=2950441 RepID=A0ABT1FCA0_9GAMM|nr:DegQ family serine endoprotease [Dyella lutea]MCP1374992.1 DegQ family serine endoprotease [Dyella lutea]